MRTRPDRRARRGERGQSATEYVAVLAAAAAIVVLVGSIGLADRAAELVQRVACSLGGGSACAPAPGAIGPPPGPGPAATRITRLERDAERRRTTLLIDTPAAAGSRFKELHDAAQDAVNRGDLDRAEEINRQLEAYIRLARGPDLAGSDRGAILEDLWVSDQKWRQAVDRRTAYLPPDGDNVRFFEIPRAPGDGMIVMDYFISTATSGPPPAQLKGDNRTFAPGGPLDAGLPLNRSRVLVVLDRETGRGAIYQSHTCNVFYGQCREARPIALDMEERTTFVPELSDEVRGPYIAPTNRYEITGDAQSMRLRYDALNSMTWPIFSVDGDITLTRRPDGTYAITADDRDNYPSIGIYQYGTDGSRRVIQERDGEPVIPGAVPHG